MGFLGHVNVFHGRVEAGRAHLGPLSVEYPEHADETSRPAQGFARPYELELAREAAGDGFWATLRHVNPAGAVIKLELEDDEARLVQVEIDARAVRGPAPESGRAALRAATAGAGLRGRRLRRRVPDGPDVKKHDATRIAGCLERRLVVSMGP